MSAAPTDPATESEATRPPVLVVAGPTAAGKTELAIGLARRFDAEIVNADSMQVYRHLDVGTAKPTVEQRARAVHHLIDVVDPDQPYNAGFYARDARAAATAIHERGRPVLLTGGTGLYIRAFLEGLIDSAPANPELRARLEAEHREARAAGDPGRLHRRLAEDDPEAAARIHPNDLTRTIRALELLEATGQAASALRRRHGFGDRRYRVLYLVVDPGREELAARIAQRCQAMVEGGLLQEVRDLRERGYGPELPCMQAIGYRHIEAVIQGSDTLRNAGEAMRRDTLRFARRQRTWFRAIPDAVWMHPNDEVGILKSISEFLG